MSTTDTRQQSQQLPYVPLTFVSSINNIVDALKQIIKLSTEEITPLRIEDDDVPWGLLTKKVPSTVQSDSQKLCMRAIFVRTYDITTLSFGTTREMRTRSTIKECNYKDGCVFFVFGKFMNFLIDKWARGNNKKQDGTKASHNLGDGFRKLVCCLSIHHAKDSDTEEELKLMTEAADELEATIKSLHEEHPEADSPLLWYNRSVDGKQEPDPGHRHIHLQGING